MACKHIGDCCGECLMRHAALLQGKGEQEMKNHTIPTAQHTAQLLGKIAGQLDALLSGSTSIPIRGGGTGNACGPAKVDSNECGEDYCGSPQGVRATAVPAGATVDIFVTPDYGFTPSQFVYNGPAASFSILQVRNGNRNPVTSTINADTYSARTNAVSIPAKWGRFEPYRPMVVTVRNDTGGPLDFDGTMFGVLHTVEADHGTR